MSALHNLTNVGKVTMVGRRAHESSVPLAVDGTAVIGSGNAFFTVSGNLTTKIATGDPVVFTQNVAESTTFYISKLTFAWDSSTVYLNLPFTCQTSTAIKANIGTRRVSKALLPGLMSIVPNSRIYSAAPGEQVIYTYANISTAVFYIMGQEYTKVQQSCSDGICWHKITTNYAGPAVTKGRQQFMYLVLVYKCIRHLLGMLFSQLVPNSGSVMMK